MTSSSPPRGPVVGIDLGGTDIKAALVAADGTVVHSIRRATHRERGPQAVVEAVADTAAAVVAENDERTGQPLLGVGVVVPGLVDESAGVATYSANLGWRDLPLRDLLGERLGLPVVLGHDVRAGAVAESRLGAGRGHDDFVFVALGTGIAAAHVRGGQVLRGHHYAAGELGHLVVSRTGPRCGCGRRGCLEVLASASAIARRYHRAVRPRDRDAKGASAEQVCRLAVAGDPVARRVWATAVAALADGLAAYTVLCDPGLIVLGGGVARAGATLTDPLRSALATRLAIADPPEVAIAQLGTQAGCRGAALLAFDRVVAGVAAFAAQSEVAR
ncbi:ROK family protein [Streptomyces sp. HO565]|uniref:ROK family protein n=1 Tax=Streptomyces sp. HO565 TaxID=2857489 RepID=UPI0034DC4A5C